MRTRYYQLRLVDGVIDIDGNTVTYNDGYYVLEGGTFEVCHGEGVRMVVRMKDLVRAGILTNAFVQSIENHLHIVEC